MRSEVWGFSLKKQQLPRGQSSSSKRDEVHLSIAKLTKLSLLPELLMANQPLGQVQAMQQQLLYVVVPLPKDVNRLDKYLSLTVNIIATPRSMHDIPYPFHTWKTNRV